MTMKKTLGGDRLGAGKRMQVELHNYGRSSHNKGYIFRTTMSAGTLVPFICQVALPGDTWDINLDSEIKTHPTIGPLFASFKAQYDVFTAPIRLYQGALHNNKLGIGRKMSEIKLPLFRMAAISVDNAIDLNNSQINPSCIWAYLGVRGVGHPNDGLNSHTRDFNAIPLLAYWDIYKNYYANKQEEIGAVIHAPSFNIVDTVQDLRRDEAGPLIPELPAAPANVLISNGNLIQIVNSASVTPFTTPEMIMLYTDKGIIRLSDVTTIESLIDNDYRLIYDSTKYGTITAFNYRIALPNEIRATPVQVTTFPLENLDKMREELLRAAGSNVAKIINVDAETNALTPYNFLTASANRLASQEGLALKTYNSDLFNNWLKTEWIDGPGGITEITAIDTSGGSFTIDTLNLSKKVYDMLNRIAVSGGTYDDWIDAVYTHDRFTRIETPIYNGGLIKELVFQELSSLAESQTDNGQQPLGTLAGKGVLSKKHKGGHIVIKVDEPSYIIGIVSLTPRIDYSQGNNWDVNLKTMDDFHKPALDEIGFQELITEQMAWWSTYWSLTTEDWQTRSAGKQPAWINYMTDVNKTYGNFAIESNEMFMTLNRKYEPEFVLDEGAQIFDLTTYIDPAKYNSVFAQTALDSQNFWMQIAVDITARRKMSAKIMPNL